jgi:hypothetical protein
MAEVSEKEMQRRKVGRPAGRKQVEHFIMRIEPRQKGNLKEMADAKHMNMSEFMNYLLSLSWKNYQASKDSDNG